MKLVAQKVKDVVSIFPIVLISWTWHSFTVSFGLIIWRADFIFDRHLED